jgi:ethanolaminephosphotransferase
LRNERANSTGSFLFTILALHRIIQRWNQTGQKFAGAPDVVKDILRPNPVFLWVLVTVTYLTLLYRIGNHMFHDLKSGSALATACSLTLVVPAFLFKLGFTANDAPELLSWLGNDNVQFLERIPLVGSARIIFLTLVSEVIWAFSASANAENPTAARRRKYALQPSNSSALIVLSGLAKILMSLLTLFLVTQSRTTNIPLFLFFSIQLDLLSQLHLSPLQVTITTLILGQVSFFALGNSNAISSIDLSNAYNGVSGYNVVAVGILVFLSNWAGPIWWSIAGITLLVQTTTPRSQTDEGSKEAKRKQWVQMEMENLLPKKIIPSTTQKPQEGPVFFTHATVLTLFTSISLLAVMVACTVLRTHLFIWTVFSPKYLYAMSWTMAFHLIISLGVGGGLWRACTR